MPTFPIFNQTISTLERSLDLRSMRHRVLASNIANMDTPNYKAVELEVEGQIRQERGFAHTVQLVRTHANHIPVGHTADDSVKLKTADPAQFSLRGDGNTVDVDRTMGQLAENTILYRTAAQLISERLRGVRYAIKGGR